MRIKMSGTTRLQGVGRLAEGAVVEVSDEEAKHMIAEGIAEETTAKVTEDPAPEGTGSATVPDRPEDFHVALREAATEPTPEPTPEPEAEPEAEPVPENETPDEKQAREERDRAARERRGSEPTTTGASARRTLGRN